MKNVLLVICLVVFSVAVAVPSVYADKRTAREVQQLIKDVETKLEKYKDSGADKLAGMELNKIENHLKSAKALLDNGDEDFSFYEIGKADAYFNLIDAKKDLEAAKKEFNSASRTSGK